MTSLTKNISFATTSIVLVFAASPAPVSAADHTTCNDYANTAIFHEQLNQMNGCGYGGLRWHESRELHYSWCLFQGKGRVLRENVKRVNKLKKCGAV